MKILINIRRFTHTHTHKKFDASFAHKIKEQISFKHGIWGTS